MLSFLLKRFSGRHYKKFLEKARPTVARINEIESKVLAHYATYTIGTRNRFRMYRSNVHGWGLHPNEDNAMRMEDCWKS